MAEDQEKKDKESLESIQNQNKAANELLSTYQKIKGADKEILDISKQLVAQSNNIANSIQKRLDKTSTVKDITNAIKKLEQDRIKTSENATKLADAQQKALKKQQDLTREIATKSRQRNEAENKAIGLTDSLIRKEAEMNALAGSRNSQDRDRVRILAQEIADDKISLNYHNKKIDLLDKEKTKLIGKAKIEKDNAKQLGDGIKANEEIGKQQDEELKLANKTLSAKKAAGALDSLAEASGLKRLMSAFALTSVLKMMIDGFFKLDQQATQMARSLGISKDSAMAMRQEMQAYANASGDAFVTGERLAKAQEGLTEQLGIAVDFGNKERETFARLTEITGLSAQEAGKLAQNSAAMGMGTREYVSNLRVAAMEASRANKIHISDKELLSTVSKLSAGILVKFQGNPKALAEAVIQSKKLGLSLEQVDKTGESLLNWESSIQNELEAELITGRKLNLEKARAAALTGDQATLMQEVANQAGSLEDFQHMNVLAQESLAKAFGMSREEMSEMLMKQEAVNKYGDAANKLNAEQLQYMKDHNMSADEMLEKVENQRSLQEQFNDLMTKFQETLAGIAAGPLGTILGMFASLLSNAWAMYTVVGLIAAVYGGQMLAGIAKMIVQLGTELAVRTSIAIAAVTAAEASTLGIATIAIVGGLAAVMAYMSSASKKSMKDGIMGPSGKVLYSGKEGAIKLNDNDTVIAGTNLGGGVKKQQQQSNPGMAAMGAMASAIDKLAAASNRPAVAYINGRDAFADNMGNSSLGTSQVKNSYKLA
jgi:hypothetical protein